MRLFNVRMKKHYSKLSNFDYFDLADVESASVSVELSDPHTAWGEVNLCNPTKMNNTEDHTDE